MRLGKISNNLKKSFLIQSIKTQTQNIHTKTRLPACLTAECTHRLDFSYAFFQWDSYVILCVRQGSSHPLSIIHQLRLNSIRGSTHLKCTIRCLCRVCINVWVHAWACVCVSHSGSTCGFRQHQSCSSADNPSPPPSFLPSRPIIRWLTGTHIHSKRCPGTSHYRPTHRGSEVERQF